MPTRIATFNVENLFDRPMIMNLPQWQDGRQVLEDHARLNRLFQKDTYSAPDKQDMLERLERNGLLSTAEKGQFMILRRIRGKLLYRPKGQPVEVAAGGCADWIGWVELRTEPVNRTAIQNTARVIKEINADVLGVVEAEDRPGLQHFNSQVIPDVEGTPYGHVMLIDGNDDRGLDVGLMSRDAYPIASMRSHVDDRVDSERVFSRDCPEYEVKLPSGESLWVLVNHFKSKGYGKPAESDARRKQQARRVREIYAALRAPGARYVAVIGDLNDTPQRDPLSPLLGSGSDLRDISAHARFRSDGRAGTHGNGTASGKLDYMLLSPELFARVLDATVERRGVWGGTHGTLWEHFPTMERLEEAASDHAALWADLDV
jgi:endonuclease/exonuclease/phosphatase family metal-dependent hydrolase